MGVSRQVEYFKMYEVLQFIEAFSFFERLVEINYGEGKNCAKVFATYIYFICFWPNTIAFVVVRRIRK